MPVSEVVELTDEVSAVGAVTPAVDHKTTRFYRPELDALRFLAFLSVYLCHGLPVGESPLYSYLPANHHWVQVVREAGNFGVCLFFTLSSYLITGLLRREFIQAGSIDLKAFYVRRTLRIWPLYFFVLLVFAAIGVFVPHFHVRLNELGADLLFIGNWHLMFAATASLSWLWSISIEEQFYLVWPAMVRFGGLRCVAMGSALCFPVAALAVVIANRYQPHNQSSIWLNSFVQFQFFGLGSILALLLAGRVPRTGGWQRAALFVFGCACWVYASGYCQIKTTDIDPGVNNLLLGYWCVGLGCVCFLLSVLGMSAKRLPQWLLYLGKISYGLYMFHGISLLVTPSTEKLIVRFGRPHAPATFVWMFCAKVVFSLGLTVFLAALSYKYLESPFLRLKRRFTVVESR
jgi:peptidoglycan/LPS O-acetylase OafA/YrhL